MSEETKRTSIMPPPIPPPHNEMHQMGIKLIEMGLDLLRNQPYPPIRPFNAESEGEA